MMRWKEISTRALLVSALAAILVSLQASAFTDEERIRWKRKQAAEESQRQLEACRETPEAEGCEELLRQHGETPATEEDPEQKKERTRKEEEARG